MNDVLAAFERDPAGWTAVIVALISVGLGAAFHRRLWAAVKASGRALVRFLKWSASLRLVTKDKLVPPPRAPQILRPVRWELRERKNERNVYALANLGAGSIARDVRLDVLGSDVVIQSSAFWDSVDGGEIGVFRMTVSGYSMMMGMQFVVEYTDGNGVRQEDIIHIRGM